MFNKAPSHASKELVYVSPLNGGDCTLRDFVEYLLYPYNLLQHTTHRYVRGINAGTARTTKRQSETAA
jgi:hypothetical protein